MKICIMGLLLAVCSLSACADEWVHYNGKSFGIDHPRNWQVHSPTAEGQIVLQNDQGERLVIWPLFVQQPVQRAGAGQLLQRIAYLLDARLPWEYPRPVGEGMLKTSARAPDRSGVCALRWFPTSGGTAAFVYCVIGSEEVIRQNEALYAKIIQSLQLHGGSGKARSASSMPAFRYRRWADPVEYMFDMEIPADWRIQGGTYRRNALEVTVVLELVSPDGQIRIFAGEPGPVYRIVPTPNLAMWGYTEGSMYGAMPVMQYRTGVEYARQTAYARWGQQCPQFQLTHIQDRPEAARALNRLHQQSGMGLVITQLTTGEVYFRCSQGGQPLAGYVFAGTTLIQGTPYIGNMALWYLQFLYGYIAPAGREMEARAVLTHMIQTVRPNPQWFAAQHQTTGAISKIFQQQNEYLSNLISQQYWNQQRSQDEMNRRFSNYIRGTEDVVDPTTGQAYQVASSSNYYWIDDLQNMVGTDLYANPDVLRFREMIRLP